MIQDLLTLEPDATCTYSLLFSNYTQHKLYAKSRVGKIFEIVPSGTSSMYVGKGSNVLKIREVSYAGYLAYSGLHSNKEKENSIFTVTYDDLVKSECVYVRALDMVFSFDPKHLNHPYTDEEITKKEMDFKEAIQKGVNSPLVMIYGNDPTGYISKIFFNFNKHVIGDKIFNDTKKKEYCIIEIRWMGDDIHSTTRIDVDLSKLKKHGCYLHEDDIYGNIYIGMTAQLVKYEIESKFEEDAMKFSKEEVNKKIKQSVYELEEENKRLIRMLKEKSQETDTEVLRLKSEAEIEKNKYQMLNEAVKAKDAYHREQIEKDIELNILRSKSEQLSQTKIVDGLIQILKVSAIVIPLVVSILGLVKNNSSKK